MRESDFFRNAPGRWLGYGHVLGRALPSTVVSPLAKIWMSRTTGAYIIFDTVYKAIDHRRYNPVLKAADALVWQGLASVLIPGLALEGVARGSYMLVHTLKLSKPLSRYIPLGMVLLTLPLFGDFFDDTVDYVLDHTYRPLFLR